VHLVPLVRKITSRAPRQLDRRRGSSSVVSLAVSVAVPAVQVVLQVAVQVLPALLVFLVEAARRLRVPQRPVSLLQLVRVLPAACPLPMPMALWT
jgi:hypothetical protein